MSSNISLTAFLFFHLNPAPSFSYFPTRIKKYLLVGRVNRQNIHDCEQQCEPSYSFRGRPVHYGIVNIEKWSIVQCMNVYIYIYMTNACTYLSIYIYIYIYIYIDIIYIYIYVCVCQN